MTSELVVSVEKLKQRIRRDLRQRLRAGVHVESFARLKERLYRLLLTRPGLWLGYRPMKDEPELPEVKGVQWAYPVVIDKETIEFYSCGDANASTFRRGFLGIEEPDLSQPGWSKVECARGAFVPGLGFDRHLRPLGRGGGYYDRFMARFTTEVVRIVSDPKERAALGEVVIELMGKEKA